MQHSIFEHLDSPRLTKAQARKERSRQRKLGNLSAPLTAKTHAQRQYITALQRGESMFAIGPAGTGKTHLPARIAARKLADGVIEKIMVSRVAVTSPHHQLGFLPGKLDAKMRPWLIPIFDAIKTEVGSHLLDQWISDGRLEICPFQNMRGRTLGEKPSFILLDEAQNSTTADLKLFLTRMGEGAQCIITGDLDQIDILDSGLKCVVEMVQRYDIPMGVVQFQESDVVRSAFTAAWVRAFSAEQKGLLSFTEPAKPSGKFSEIKPVPELVQNLDQLPDFIHSPRIIKSA